MKRQVQTAENLEEISIILRQDQYVNSQCDLTSQGTDCNDS